MDRNMVNEKKLRLTVALNLIITAAEVAGGLLSGSLSLLSDALHNFSDAVSMVISLLAMRLARRERTAAKTFGYKRAEIMAALFNAAGLVVISFFLFREAYFRFIRPAPVNGALMLIVAVIGLLANFLCVLLLHHEAEKNLNVRSAYLHLLADTLSSVGVVLAALLIRFAGISWIDPLMTVLIGLFVLKESLSIVRQAVNILMQAAPENFSLQAVQQAVEAVDGVHSLHHVHVWQMDDCTVHFEGHIDVCQDLPISAADELRKKIENMLTENFSIQHITLQMEYRGNCREGLIRQCR